MDDTGASLKAAEGAAATRKRRSSILKSQRPPRTPFSELEFNVATPTDTAKSRRVSFSRRTGVAEFITNEATTTWKNFYEEHNKSLESSGNESAANAGRQVIGHIGKRIFDQQFEEVEVVDIGGTLQTNTAHQEFQTSFNNVNITQQLEYGGDGMKLADPVRNFDLSSLTDHHSKIFGNDVTIPVMNEMSNQININFSNLQSMGNSKCDDLDEIRRDLERSHPSNVVCQGPFSGRRDISEYIEIDLNMTSVGVRSDDCDMSITDTIQSPNVQEVIKTNTSTNQDGDDWVVDKENIVVNPYTTPKETLNFAINEVSDEVLVFDGKKLTVQSEKKPCLDTDNQNIQKNTQITKDVTPKRKTIVLNMNDDLPNFIQDSSSPMSWQNYNAPKDIGQEKKSVIYNDFDLSITQSVDNKIDVPKRKTIVFEDDMGNISITQAVPAKVIIHKEEKRKTILYENDLTNLSITQAVPTNIISGSKSMEENRTSDDNISFTRALPSNLILNDNTKQSQDKTVYFHNDFDISVTQAIPQNIISSKLENIENINKNNTKNDLNNLSITQAIPCNIIINEIKTSEVGKTIIYDNNQDADVETTQVVSDDLLFEKNNADKRKTIVYDHDAGNISITQAIPSNIIFIHKNNDPDANTSQINNKTKEKHKNVSINTETVSEALKEVNNERKSLRSNVTVYGDQAEVSFTSVMPTNILQSNVHEQYDMETTSDNDISITRALPSNILLPAEDHVITKLEPINKEANVTIPNKDLNKTERKDVSMNVIGNISRMLQETKFNSNDLSNLSLTKPIPTEILNIQNDFPRKCEIDTDKSVFKDNNASVNQDIFIYRNAEQTATVINEINQSNFKVDDIKEISNNSFNKNNDSIRRNLTLNQSTIENRSSDESNNFSTGKDLSHEEGLIERESLKEIEILPICQHESEVIRIEENSNKAKMSILSELLNMSRSSLNDVNKSEVKVLTDNVQPALEKSSDSLFFITRDGENDINIEKNEENINSKKDNRVSSGLPKIPLQQQALETEDTEQDSYLKQKVDELKIMNEFNTKTLNRHYENVLSSDLRKSIENLDNSNVSRGKKTIKNADDTAELLEMLSDFTDGQSDDHAKNKTLGIIETKGSETLANKSKLARLSFVPKRQSIAFSREDLLNNISMAQAALQQSRFEMDESGSIEDTNDSPEEDDYQTKKSPKKSVRMSTEVVKTLQFEGDSINDDSAMADEEISPLKKTAFGETAYMKEDKARVIPSYLKDVSDGIKALMHDLVKPMADVLPYETAELHQTKETPSTCSTQIQASLVTSSQIDINVELKSTADSLDNIKSNQSIVTEIAAAKQSVSHTLKQIFNPAPINTPLEIERAPKIETKMNTLISRDSKSGPVILFDHHNPLNNILLNHTECTKVHKYNPLSIMSIEDDIDEINKDKKSEVASVSMHYNVERFGGNQFLPSGDACDEKNESISIGSNVSKPLSVNRSTEGLGLDVKHIEVNTVIAMKANQELLESNSSLTLVDDALAQSAFDLKVDLASSDDSRRSNLKVIYDMDTDENQLRNIELDCDEENEDINDNCTTRKRSYSPTKPDKNRASRPNVEITPKPLNKMQKISNSPQLKNKEREQYIEKSPDKKSPKKRNSSKPEQVITVQQLISECYRITKMDQSRDELTESPSVTLETETISPTATSVTSANTVNVSVKERQDTSSVDSQAVTVLGSEVSRVNWQPDVVEELSSKNLLVECSSSVNVVAKINTLPFMGSRECEWESSSGDVWMFRLLRSRIRLTVRLAHSHHNASRSRVRADTQLVASLVDPVQEESDPLAALCVRLATKAMRYECSRATSAGDVPALLRRCAALARVALRWARAMRDARVRLAYSVTPEGELTLKVANVPLRAVWEVRLAVELVAEESGVAWPRAGHVRAASVLAGARPPSPPRLARLLDKLPHDWGHAPAVLWKVFRYLKNKTREDDLLAL
ncbi:uncharacterized protein LOC126779436 [Nymphalis io]|uniref:uncharacterized protein LOC126779436 n=1 Tax=Inachis io TaxID=171585 RepID=UPI002168B4C8|nr:uncharacterized protein LOC126779436 [Nymphalis io]